jgi:SAM-dependent methyltransferase
VSVIKRWLKKHFHAISWRNSILKPIFIFLDFPDWIIRRMRGFGDLPKYSLRIRSTGIEGEFGGKRFVGHGEKIKNLLIQHSNLRSSQKVVEIGCGTGSAALALADILDDSNYRGADIDRLSIDACLRNKRLMKKKFHFDWLDIYHSFYNPQGSIPPSSYRFPYANQSTDVVFLISVFTHMLPKEMSHYIGEISRLLVPGGFCLFTTFLMDNGHEGVMEFPFRHENYRLHQEEIPEKAVGYYQNFLDQTFQSSGLNLFIKPVLGNWRSFSEQSDNPFGQDMMIYQKRG